MNTDRIEGAVKKVAGKVEGAVGDLTGHSDSQVEGRLRQAEGAVQETYGNVKETLRNSAESVGGMTEETIEAGARYYREGSQAVGRHVEENPLGAVLVAAAAGYALAWLIHGQRH